MAATDATNMIYVSSLNGLNAVAAGLASFDLMTLMSPGHVARDHLGLAHSRHLELSFHDIVEDTPGLIAPDRVVVQAILDFGRTAPPERPLLVHCWAGISRSSAAAYVVACDRNPGHEVDLAEELRRRAPFATPNRLMVALADEVLGRDGCMVDAIARIGRGADAFEGTAYQLPRRWPIG